MNRTPSIVPRPPAPTGLPSGRAGYSLVLLLMGICFLGHFNRLSIEVAAVSRIMPEYDISATSMGLIYSAFLVTYTVMMIPGGWLIDRRGPKFALQLVMFGSAIFVLLSGVVGWVTASAWLVMPALFVVRALMGLVSAPLHPAAATAVAVGVPLDGRAAANGLVTGAALLGIASTYVVFGALIDFLDWPGAFAVAAAATLGWGFLWTRMARLDVNGLSAAPEVEPITAGVVEANRSSTGLWDRIQAQRNLLLLTFSYAAVGYFQYLFFYWMHYYFDKVLNLGAEQSRFYAAIPPLAMALGMPLGGRLSDALLRRFGWRVARAGLGVFAMSTSAVLLLVGISATQPLWIVTWLSLALGALGMVEGPFWTMAVEVGGRRGGMSAAIFNTGGNAGGIAAPLVTPWIAESLDYGWQAGIAVGSLVCLLGAVAWLGIDCRPQSDWTTGQVHA